MQLIKVADDTYVNMEQVTYIKAKKRDKITIMFHENSAGGLGMPSTYVELKGADAEMFLRWLERNAESAHGK